MNKIHNCLVWSDAITFELVCDDKTKEILSRLLFIANVQHKEGVAKSHQIYGSAYNHFNIIITSEKDFDRVLPTLQKHFIGDEYLTEDFISNCKELFK